MPTPKKLSLFPIRSINGTLALPGSKSLSNRALLLAMLAQGTTVLENVLDAEDVHHMLDTLQKLGVSCSQTADTVTITGTGGQFPQKQARCFLGNSGTSMRSLTAALCAGQGDYTLEGISRMYERPIGDLVDGLTALGAKIEYLGQIGYPPLRIHPATLRGGTVQISGKTSSQYLSAMLMLAPYAAEPVRIDIRDELISKPYVDMTMAIMKRFGLSVEKQGDYRSFLIPTGVYQSPGHYWIESDASSASYFLAAGAIGGTQGGGTVRVEGVGSQSTQGDAQFARVLEQMGATVRYEAHAIEIDTAPSLEGIDIDMNNMPDVAMTLAIVALFAKTPTSIRNIASWKVKETDRLQAMHTELTKIGAHTEIGEDWIRVFPLPRASFKEAEISTYNDHRIAMCFSLIALSGTPVTILDPQCTAKTFPHYFEAFEKLLTH
jgi:3-phosphoshikimate 1-carboxyvinyltransferase